jgi:PAS domain S-box-containing protein
MGSIHDISIKWKLITLLLATSLGGLLLVSTAIGVFELGRIRHSMLHELTMQAELVAAHSAAAVAAGDAQAAQERLACLSAVPEITDTYLFTAEGTLLAEYVRDNAAPVTRPAPPRLEAGHRIEAGRLAVTCLVRQGLKPVGAVILCSDLSEQRARMRAYAGIGAVTVLGALLVALLLSLRLQGIVSRPILRLNEVARAVSEGHDYSLRASKKYNDEVGALVDSFNQMLAQIQQRSEDLRESELRFRQVTESILEVFWMLDAETRRVLYISPGYETIWGRTCAKLYACPEDWQEGIHPEDKERVVEAFRTRVAKGDYDEEYRIVRPDGSMRWIHGRSFPVRNKAGAVYRVAGIAEDVTRYKQLEMEILKIGDHERTRIGQDLHDSICQELVRIAFACNSLRNDLARQTLPEAAAAGNICAMLDKTISESCHLARGLYPTRLGGEGLVAALADLASETSRNTGLTCELDCPEPVQIHNYGTAVHLFRLAQEAVNNAVKHSEASRVNIRLRADAAAVHLTVADDGIGLPTTAWSAQGMGLDIMRYRAQEMGGRLDIRRGRSGGTIVRCSVPPEMLNGYDHGSKETQKAIFAH